MIVECHELSRLLERTTLATRFSPVSICAQHSHKLLEATLQISFVLPDGGSPCPGYLNGLAICPQLFARRVSFAGAFSAERRICRRSRQ
jgi:hypothetical protein